MSAPTLFGLPVELRRNIFELVYVRDTAIVVSSTKYGWQIEEEDRAYYARQEGLQKKIPFTNTQVSGMLVDKQYFLESVAVFYSRNTFSLETPQDLFAFSLLKAANLIGSLAVQCTSSVAFERLSSSLPAFRRLRRLHIHVLAAVLEHVLQTRLSTDIAAEKRCTAPTAGKAGLARVEIHLVGGSVPPSTQQEQLDVTPTLSRIATYIASTLCERLPEAMPHPQYCLSTDDDTTSEEEQGDEDVEGGNNECSDELEAEEAKAMNDYIRIQVDHDQARGRL